MPAHNPFEYDVAVSFATDDRAVAEELAGLLAARKMKVLRAEYQPVELGGSDFLTYIAEMYRTKAQYCLLLISKHYPLNAWTEAERASARLLQEVNDLRREMDALQTENERLRGDRAEAAELLTDGITRALQDAIVRLRPAAARPEITREPSFS